MKKPIILITITEFLQKIKAGNKIIAYIPEKYKAHFTSYRYTYNDLPYNNACRFVNGSCIGHNNGINDYLIDPFYKRYTLYILIDRSISTKD